MEFVSKKSLGERVKDIIDHPKFQQVIQVESATVHQYDLENPSYLLFNDPDDKSLLRVGIDGMCAQAKDSHETLHMISPKAVIYLVLTEVENALAAREKASQGKQLNLENMLQK